MKITIIGAGYVGLSLSTLLAQKHEVYAVDINKTTIDLINSRKSPIGDDLISEFFETKDLNLVAGFFDEKIISESEVVIISTPTSYDPNTNQFDTQSVEDNLGLVSKLNTKALVIIKSTVPVGFTSKMRDKFENKNITFSPEFLREGNALKDNLYPSRIIMGETDNVFEDQILQALVDLSLNNPEVIKMDSTDAEAVKLFSNTYLAMRVSFFNELDTFSELKDLNTKNIIKGVSLDPRIGDFYNNPSFGYGGYCLPKDTKQLLYNFDDVPQNLIEAIVKSNETRKNHISKVIAEKEPKTVGIYRLVMKSGSDNFRDSAIFDIINNLLELGIKIVIYEPNLSKLDNYKFESNIEDFLKASDIIIANRIDDNIKGHEEKVYSRDIFSRD